MANIVAFQTLGEMSTPRRAAQYATRNTADSQPRLGLYKPLVQAVPSTEKWVISENF
jgi:hypothetical protein